MLYLLGTNLLEKKKVKIALRSFFGIGGSRAQIICDKLNIHEKMKIEELSKEQQENLIKELKNFIIEGDLRKIIDNNINNSINLGSYIGIRHSNLLPVRGQRTRSNAKTKKRLGNKYVKIKTIKNKDGKKKKK